jgi:hypothetical protein
LLDLDPRLQEKDKHCFMLCQEQGIVAERLFGDKEILLETRIAVSSAAASLSSAGSAAD